MIENDAATTFFLQVVRPTVADYLKSPGDFRLACLASIVLWTMVDHYHAARAEEMKEAGVRSRKDARVAFDAKGLAFTLLHDVAEATKHAMPKGNREGVAFAQVYQGFHRGAGGYGMPASGYGVAGAYATTGIVVEVSAGKFEPLEPCVRTVLGYWERVLGIGPLWMPG